jgi:hypothetical protein
MREAPGAVRPSPVKVGALGALVVAAAAAIAAVLLTRTDQPPTVVANSLVKIDARTNKVVDVVRVGGFPAKVVAGYGSVWVVDVEDETLTRVGARSSHADLVGGLTNRFALAAGAGAIWVIGPQARPSASPSRARAASAARRLPLSSWSWIARSIASESRLLPASRSTSARFVRASACAGTKSLLAARSTPSRASARPS